jgi:hypothetical protein
MKALQIRLADDTGKVYRWTIRRVPRAINCTLGRPTRVVSGWEFESNDGCVRFAEGNWHDLTAIFHSTAENYGLRLISELS